MKLFKKLAAGFVAALALMSCAMPALAIPATLVVVSDQYSNITTSTTVTLKSGQGNLHSFCVNTVGTTSTLVLWDSLTASGTKIGSWTTVGQGCFIIDANFRIGLTVVTAGGSPADLTVVWQNGAVR
jgi:hypothetical protein